MKKNTLITLGCAFTLGLTCFSLVGCGTSHPSIDIDIPEETSSETPSESSSSSSSSSEVKEPEKMAMDTYFKGVRVFGEKDFDPTFDKLIDRELDTFAQDILFRLNYIYGDCVRDHVDYTIQYDGADFEHNGSKAMVHFDKLITKNDIPTPNEFKTIIIGDADNFQEGLNVWLNSSKDNSYLNGELGFWLDGATKGYHLGIEDLCEGCGILALNVQGTPWNYPDLFIEGKPNQTVVNLIKNKGIELLNENGDINSINQLGFNDEFKKGMIQFIFDEIIGTELVKTDNEQYAILKELEVLEYNIRYGIVNCDNPVRICKFYDFLVSKVVEEAISNTFEDGTPLYPTFNKLGVTIYYDFADDIRVNPTGRLILMPKNNAPTTKLFLFAKTLGPENVDVTFKVTVRNGAKSYNIEYSDLLERSSNSYVIDLGAKTNNMKLSQYNGSMEEDASTDIYDTTSAASSNNGNSYIEISFETRSTSSLSIGFDGMNDIL